VGVAGLVVFHSTFGFHKNTTVLDIWKFYFVEGVECSFNSSISLKHTTLPDALKSYFGGERGAII
jgi:hypothetical protein